MANKSKNDRTVECTTFAAALTAKFPDTQTWIFKGVTYKRGDLIALANTCVTATQNTKATHDTWSAAVLAERTARGAFDPVASSFRQWLDNLYGETSQEVGEFGFAPSKPVVRTAESKAASVAKAKATRAAKKAALATVGSPAVAPAAAPATPAPGGSSSNKTS